MFENVSRVIEQVMKVMFKKIVKSGNIKRIIMCFSSGWGDESSE